MDTDKIKNMVLVCIILHNMMVEERLELGLDEDDEFADDNFGFELDEDAQGVDCPPSRAQEEVEIVEAEVRRRLQII
jgi:hypothetical protein